MKKSKLPNILANIAVVKLANTPQKQMTSAKRTTKIATTIVRAQIQRVSQIGEPKINSTISTVPSVFFGLIRFFTILCKGISEII